MPKFGGIGGGSDSGAGLFGIFNTLMSVFSLGVFVYTLLKPKKKVKVEDPKPFEIPEELIGSPLPVLFGTRYIKPKIAWWGDTKILKISLSEGGKKT